MRNVQKSTRPSSRRRENAAAIVKAPPPGALTKGPDRKFPGLHPPPGGATSPSLPTNRRFAFPILAFLAVLAVGLLFLLPGGLLQAQSAEQFFTYAEDGTGPVATFTASDPEGATPSFWMLVQSEGFTAVDVNDVDIVAADVAHEKYFKIDQNGVLRFRASPDYERAGDTDAPMDNVYRVTVQVSDGSIDEYFEATVKVTDVEETGKVTWTVTPSGVAIAISELQQFQPSASLTASVTDPDAATSSDPTGAVTDITSWKWYRGSTMISGQTEATYTVDAADVGMRIRVEATYSDGNVGPAETRSFTSPHPVRAFRRAADNTAPVFSPTGVTRRVEENSTGNVGGPVTATDADGDRLTYTLPPDEAVFKIDAASGQLMVGDGVELNYEVTRSYDVMVTATDPLGNITLPESTHTPATVTINVIDVDEKPTFDTGSVAAGVVAAQTEGMTTVIDTDDGPVTLVASDPEGEKVTLSLMGDDASSFELADADDGDGTNAVMQVLSFMEKPDYEMPGDRNRDNVYEVTVRASDGTMNADRALIIKVINDEEGGKVTVSPEDAVVGVELTASLAHMEGGVAASGQIANQMWQWQRAVVPDVDGETCADVSTWMVIANATDATYTPVRADLSTADPAGGCLSAMVTYTYQFAAGTTTAESDGTLVLVSQANQAPKFKEGTRTFRVVMEDVKAADPNDDSIDDVPADNVGSPIVATDANGDTPTYTLGGADASLFRVRAEGQLEVKGKLDHEMDSSHTVTVTVNDGSGASNDSATITVTIYVTDADEAPTIKDRADPTAEGMQTVVYRENSTGPVARFMASDPERATPIVWMLVQSEGFMAVDVNDVDIVAADVAHENYFKIDQNGVLRFRASPDYERAGDTDGPMDNVYRVTVQTSDGNKNDYFELTVNVTDVEETGKVTWVVGVDGPADDDDIRLLQFQPGAQLLASVTDPDGSATVTAWKWYRGSTAISGQTEATYIVVADDVGNRIRVDATYTDGVGAAETVRFVSENPVQAARLPGANTAPVFSPTGVTRRVEENSKGNVGGPVTATDGNGDKLTYTLDGPDAGSFKIDMATGQLMVGDDVELNYEVTRPYVVMVTATDSLGNMTVPESTHTPATVTINVIDVDEKPTFDTGSVAAGVVAAQTEGMTTVIDTDDGPVTLVASDPEGEKVTLSLMGDDASSFELADADDGDGTNAVMQVLSFMEKPDYEMPGDRNRDNVYEVTVRASDGTMNADRALIIKVINDPAEGGKVTVSPEDAVVGVELTASLAHMEGGVAASGQIANQMWQWQRAVVPDVDGETCADATDWRDISTAEKDTYTPVSEDLSTADPAGGCLSAMVTYVYQFAPTDPATTARSVGTAVLVSQANQAPKFKEGTRTFRVVMEDVKAADPNDDSIDDVPADNVGSMIVATDANGDTLTYTLGGADASLFRIRSNGQVEVKGALDHETDSSHTVTLTANDGSGESNDSATITVTIYVTDVDEKPVIMVVPTGNQDPMFPSSSTTRSITEGDSSGRPIGAAVTATDPNPGDSLTYTLEGTDAASFSIHSGTGQLRTSAP